MPPDLSAVITIVREVGATEIMPRFGKLQANEIRSKSRPGDLVTEADLMAENVLSRRLRELLPGSVAIGEEAVYEDRSLLNRLAQDAPVWVLDPVDGTGNFARGRDCFGVIVSLVHGGRTVAGCIHDPVRDLTIAGELGNGAWLGGTRLRIGPPPADLATLSGSIGTRKPGALENRFANLVRNASAAQDYLALLQGRIHFAFYQRLTPWDHAAGALLHAEAGGHNAMLDRSTYRPVMSDGPGFLLAPDAATWDALQPLMPLET